VSIHESAEWRAKSRKRKEEPENASKGTYSPRILALVYYAFSEGFNVTRNFPSTFEESLRV
jgi:hypothetical protein